MSCSSQLNSTQLFYYSTSHHITSHGAPQLYLLVWPQCVLVVVVVVVVVGLCLMVACQKPLLLLYPAVISSPLISSHLLSFQRVRVTQWAQQQQSGSRAGPRLHGAGGAGDVVGGAAAEAAEPLVGNCLIPAFSYSVQRL